MLYVYFSTCLHFNNPGQIQVWPALLSGSVDHPSQWCRPGLNPDIRAHKHTNKHTIICWHTRTHSHSHPHMYTCMYTHNTVHGEKFAGLNVPVFNPIEVFVEILLCCLGQKCLLISIIKERHFIFMGKFSWYSWKPWKTRMFSPANLSSFTVHTCMSGSEVAISLMVYA